MALLTRIVGPLPALAGLAVSGALVPLSALVGRALASVRLKLMAATDRRVQLTSEVVTGAVPQCCNVTNKCMVPWLYGLPHLYYRPA